MSWQTILYFCSVLLTCVLTGFLAWYAWRQTHVTGARSYAYMVLAESLLALTEIGVMLAGTEPQAAFWFSLRVPFAAVIPVFWSFFALDYSGRGDWLSKPMRAALFAIPIITQVVMVTSSLHGLWLVQDVAFEKIGPLWIADTSARIPGIWYLVHTFYSTLLLVMGAGVLVVAAWRKPKLLRGQALLVSLGALTALGSALVGVFNFLPDLPFNPFVPGIGFSAVCYALAIFRFQLLKQPPTRDSASSLSNLEPGEKNALAVFFFIFILFVSGLAASGYLAYRNYEKQFRAQVESEISAIAELKVMELQNWRGERLADAKVIYENPVLAVLVRRYFENPSDPDTQAQLQAWLVSYRNYSEYERVRLLDIQGDTRLSDPPGLPPVSQGIAELIPAVVESGQVAMVDFYRRQGDQKIYLSLLIPVADRQAGSRVVGLISLSINPETYLYPFLEDWPSPRESAETLLLRRDGEAVLFLNPLRFEADAALNLHFPLTNTQLPAVKAALGQAGIVEGLDYRDQQVIADIRPVPESPWFLVAKMDTAEVYAPLRERLWQMLFAFGGLTLVAGAGLILIWRQQRLRYYQTQVRTLDALRLSEEKFRLAFDTSPDSVAITRLSDGMFVSVNKGFEKITGYTREQAIGKTSTEINIWKDPQDRRNVVEGLKATGEVRNYEASFLAQDGEIYGLISAVLIELDGGPHILNIVRDITARKQAEAELQTTFQRFQIILSSLYGGILVVNNGGRVEFANQAFCDLFNLTDATDDLIGLRTAEIIKKIENVYADPPQALARIQEIVNGGQPLRDEEIAITGGKTYIRDFIPVVIDGKQYGRIWHHLDITERKRVDEKLRESETNLSTLIENTDGSIWAVDHQYGLIVGNREFHRNTSAVLGRNLEMGESVLLPNFPPEANAEWRGYYDRALQGERFTVETATRFRDAPHHIEYRFSPIRGNGGEIYGVTVFGRDITERKQAEGALRASERTKTELLEKLNEAQHFASIGSWEWDLPGGRVWWSDETYCIFGVTQQKFTPGFETNRQFVHPDDIERYNQAFERSIQTGEPLAMDIRLVTGGGDLKYCDVKGTIIHDDEGQPLRFIGTIMDITARRQAEDALKKSNQRFEALLSQAPFTGVIYRLIYDDAKNIVDWEISDINELGAASIGLTVETAIGKRALDIFGAEVMAPYFDIARQVAASGQPRTFETHFEANDRYYLSSVFMVDSDHYANMSVDITERKRAEDALRISEKDLRESQRIAHVGNWSLNVATNQVVWSEELYKMYGFDPAVPPPPYTEHMKLFTPESWKRLSTALANTRETGVPYELELEMVRKDGGSGWMWVRGEAEVDPKGRIVGLWGAAQDITERKRAEDERRVALIKYKTLFDCFPQGITVSDEAGNILETNSAAGRLLGISEEEHTRRGIDGAEWKIVRPDGTPMPPDEFASVRALKENSVIENVVMGIVKAENFITWISVNAAPLPVKGYGVVVTYGDITERRHMEQALHESEDKYRTLVQNMQVGMVAHRPDTSVLFSNSMASQLLGLSLDQMLGKTAVDPAWHFVQEDGTRMPLDEYPVNRALAANQPVRNLVLGIIHPDREFPTWVHCDAYQVQDVDGKVQQVIVTFFDITARKQAEEQLLKTLDELKRSNTELEQFAYVASHDLQEPLRAVAGMVQLLQQRYQGQLDARADEYIGLAVEGATRMQTLINDLLAYSRVERRGNSIRETDANAALQSALRNLGTAILESGAAVTNGNLPRLEADAIQLTQLFQNLIGNAIKFRGQAPPNIHVEARDLGEAWQFSVSDNGIGIESQYHERIFLVFQRLHTRRDYPGTGIGLSICKKIVERHGGRIWIESTPGQGTTFHFTIPHRR